MLQELCYIMLLPKLLLHYGILLYFFDGISVHHDTGFLFCYQNFITLPKFPYMSRIPVCYGIPLCEFHFVIRVTFHYWNSIALSECSSLTRIPLHYQNFVTLLKFCCISEFHYIMRILLFYQRSITLPQFITIPGFDYITGILLCY